MAASEAPRAEEAWLRNPTHSRPAASTAGPPLGQEEVPREEVGEELPNSNCHLPKRMILVVEEEEGDLRSKEEELRIRLHSQEEEYLAEVDRWEEADLDREVAVGSNYPFLGSTEEARSAASDSGVCFPSGLSLLFRRIFLRTLLEVEAADLLLLSWVPSGD